MGHYGVDWQSLREGRKRIKPLSDEEMIAMQKRVAQNIRAYFRRRQHKRGK